MIVKRPELTEEHKERFKSAFKELLRNAPVELQKQWDGEIYWHAEQPIINIDNRIPVNLQGKYQALKREVRDRSI